MQGICKSGPGNTTVDYSVFYILCNPYSVPHERITGYSQFKRIKSLCRRIYCEIVRGSIAAIPKGQFEASDSLGLTIVQKYCFVIMPQAIRNMIPSLVGFIIALIKDSSLVSVIGYIDLTRAGRTVGNLTMQPLITFLCVGAIYFVICYSLSLLSSYTERRMKIK